MGNIAMSELKMTYAKDLIDISDGLLSNFTEDYSKIEEAYEVILGATQDDVSICLEKLTTALPDIFHLVADSAIDYEIKQVLAKDFLLFLSQEDISSSTFDLNFANHIYCTIVEVGTQFKLIG